MKLSEIQKQLNTDQEPHEIKQGTKTFLVLSFPEDGVFIFLKENTATTIKYEHPFLESVDGVNIKDSKETVTVKKGKPSRFWPVDDGVDRWLYDSPTFLRIDFNPSTNLVETIYK